MKDGVAEFGVARTGNFAQLLGDSVPLAQDKAGQNRLVELLVKRKLAGQEAAVERGQGKFQVVGVEAPGFLDGARTGAGAQTDIPHALDNGAHGFAGLFFGLLIGEGEEHVDVGKGEKVFAPVTAQGQQGDVQRGLSGEGAAPHFDQDAVHDGGAAADGGRAVARTLTGLADQRHLPRILLPKIVNRQSDWIHRMFCVACQSRKELLNSVSDVVSISA